ncbi:MAG TPA: hybrid sensor histidine kinase/response regulator [Polyangiaceae bacterium]|nr:hybrid sensor histidine kinase/response regulator [Polyangiaceae bacterium]
MADPTALAPAKCLLVDDRDENLRALGAILRRDDVEILVARSGPEALELLLDHSDIALAILDVQMPEMDGFELAELMRGSTRTQHVPIILITEGSHDQQRQFRGYELGAFDFLHKPIAPHVLRSKAGLFFELFRQRQQLQQQLHEQKELLRFNEMFYAVLGHDLRNPLNVISMASQVLRTQHTDPATLRTLGRVDNNVARMVRMIGDLLDLARARLAGGIPLKRDPVDGRQLLERLVQEHPAQAAERIRLQSRGDLQGRWDADRLAQLIGNLLGNAIEHGDKQGTIAVELDGTPGDHVVLTVENRGVVPAELRGQLFDPFRGGDARPGTGLGLGLYIVERIAQAHDGEVHVEFCDQEQTTVFRVLLPRDARHPSRL